MDSWFPVSWSHPQITHPFGSSLHSLPIPAKGLLPKACHNCFLEACGGLPGAEGVNLVHSLWDGSLSSSQKGPIALSGIASGLATPLGTVTKALTHHPP